MAGYLSWVQVPPWVTATFFPLFLLFLSHWLWLRWRSDCQVRSMSKIWACMCLVLRGRHATPSDIPDLYLLQLDPLEFSLKYSNSATELLSDSVAQVVRAWQAICQVVGLSPSLSHCHFYFPFFFLFIFFLLTDCQVRSMSPCASSFALTISPPPHSYIGQTMCSLQAWQRDCVVHIWTWGT